MEPALLRERAFVVGVVLMLAIYALFGSSYLALALALQNGLGYTALGAGVAFTPLGVALLVVSLAAPRLVARHGRPVAPARCRRRRVVRPVAQPDPRPDPPGDRRGRGRGAVHRAAGRQRARRRAARRGVLPSAAHRGRCRPVLRCRVPGQPARRVLGVAVGSIPIAVSEVVAALTHQSVGPVMALVEQLRLPGALIAMTAGAHSPCSASPVDHGLSNALSEATNTHLRLLTRRAYGYCWS